jgi:hypothetical protein
MLSCRYRLARIDAVYGLASHEGIRSPVRGPGQGMTESGGGMQRVQARECSMISDQSPQGSKRSVKPRVGGHVVPETDARLMISPLCCDVLLS